MIRRLFRLTEDENGALAARYVVFDAQGSHLPESRDIALSDLPGALVDLFLGPSPEAPTGGPPPSAKPPQGRLPDGFPGKSALEAAGLDTYAKVRKSADLTAISGIGEPTAEKIREALG